MPEIATALLALWNDVDPSHDAAYNDWHAREHVPQRLTVSGIVWALRYAHVGGLPMPRYLTLYGLRDPRVLDSAAYQDLLANPTPASRAMRPFLRNLSRWICTLDAQEGIERFACLAVRTAWQDAPTLPVLSAGAGAVRLVATRIPDAPGLPWLTDGQSHPVEGDRIEAWACNGVDAEIPWGRAAHYVQLSVG